MYPSNKNYILGSGRLFFGAFAPGTKLVEGGGALLYFGNSPTFNTSSESESLEHMDADNGIRVKDDEALLSLNRTGTFTVDHISPANLAKWFLGQSIVVTQGALVSVEQEITAVKRGYRYQIGESPSNPVGVKGLTTVTVEQGATPLVLNVDYTVNLATGGLTILATSILVEDGDPITITYSAASLSYNKVTSGAQAQTDGRLYFEATNPKGDLFDYVWPYVSLKPDGDFELKGEEWQTLSFAWQALKLNDTTEVVYITGRAGANVT